MHKIAVTGITGRMGQAVVQQLLNSQTEFELGGAFARAGSDVIGRDVGELAGLDLQGLAITSSVLDANFDLLIDFSLPASTMSVLEHCVALNRPLVIGTTGFNDKQLAEIKRSATQIPIVFAPNMSVGVNLTFFLLQQAANAIGSQADVEITETHHRNKLDAPSGTALKMGEIIAETQGRSLSECAVYRQGASDAPRDQASIGISSMRAGDVIGDHTVLFALDGERIEISHKASSRDIYAAGAIQAAKWLLQQPAGLYDMQDVLGLKKS